MNKDKSVTVRLESDLMEWVDEKARSRRSKKSQIIRELILDCVNAEKNGPISFGNFTSTSSGTRAVAAEPRAEYGARKTPVLANSHARKPHK